MKIKPKGRKIYRRKDRFEHMKQVRHSLGSIILTFVLAGAVGFVGYSIGSPVLAFLQERNFLAPPSSYHLSEITETAEITEITEIPETTETTEPETESETETQPPTEPEAEIRFLQKVPDLQGYILDTSALITESALEQALEEIPGSISHVIIPLKTAGGQIYYATKIQEAINSNAVQAVLPLDQIYEKVRNKGYEPVALVNTLEDDLYAKNYPACSYHRLDTGEVWEDQSFTESRLWMSPESSLTKSYLAAIAEEAETAGFRILICDGLEFPNFPRSELENLESVCSNPERWKTLQDVLTAMRADATELAFFIRVRGNDALLGELEALRAAEALPADCLLVTINEEIRKDSDQLETISELSDTLPVMLEWNGKEIPKSLKLKSYVLDPEQEQ